MQRLILPSDLPAGVWDVSHNALTLPRMLCDCYRDKLAALSLLDIASSSDPDDGPAGGVSEEATRAHFATRFCASAARVMLASLDPHDQLEDVSHRFIAAFSGGDVGLLDIPCGAGAVTATLLATVATLREHQVLPRQPLRVHVVAGDISPHACHIATDLLATLAPKLQLQAIELRTSVLPWDVLDAESTTALLHSWMAHAPHCREYFVVLANFSHFLQTSNKMHEAQPQLDEVFRWAAQRRSTLIWLEPQTNTAISGFFPRVRGWLTTRLPKTFRSTWDPAADPPRSAGSYRHPLKQILARVNVALMRFIASRQ